MEISEQVLATLDRITWLNKQARTAFKVSNWEISKVRKFSNKVLG